jgi:hypothetical protein
VGFKQALAPLYSLHSVVADIYIPHFRIAINQVHASKYVRMMAGISQTLVNPLEEEKRMKGKKLVN